MAEQRALDGKRTPGGMLQALVAVAKKLGVDTSVSELRRNYALSGDEPRISMVVAIAKELGLEARAARMQFRDLTRLGKSLPAILRCTDGSALLLVAARTDPVAGPIAVLQDPLAPTEALITVDEAQLTKLWDGEIILVKRHFSLGDERQPFGLGWLIGQVLRERKLFTDIGYAALVGTVFAIAPPFICMIILNRVLLNQSFETLYVLAGAIIILILFELVLNFVRRVLTAAAVTRVDSRLNLYVQEKLLKLPMDYFEREPTGRIVSKINRMWQIRNFVTEHLFGVFLDTVPLIAIVPAMLVLEWRLALFVFAMSATVFAVVYVCLKPLARRHHVVVRTEQARGAHLVETIYGMRTIKSLALEGLRRKEWDWHVAQTMSARHELALTANYPQSFTMPFQRMMYSGSFVLGAYLALSDPTTLNAGELIAFVLFSGRLSQPLVNLAHLQQDLAEARGALGELATIMNAPEEDVRSDTGLRQPIEGRIEFRDVRFRYSPDAAYALDGVSFEVPRGSMLGVMGRSGSGKTTVTRLLQRLHTGYEGMIKVDGMDLREINLGHLRTHIGVVPQENFLFSGSIRDNIAIARPDASMAQIIRAAQLAGAEEFIERMPRGYDTVLEEGAQNLSGGQRQRLAIARALLIDPPVLVLDEATSALDAESEAIISASLRNIARDRTVICVSHRLSMLVEADAILVLERGKVYDIGKHQELLQRCDIYRNLWYQQNRHIDAGAEAPRALAHG